MWNPFRRKPEPIHEIDDWEDKTSAWFEQTKCHCGMNREFVPGRVCPRCGHSDRWETRVVRNRYSYSKSRRDYRNDIVEVWTPQHCEVKDEEE